VDELGRYGAAALCGVVGDVVAGDVGVVGVGDVVDLQAGVEVGEVDVPVGQHEPQARRGPHDQQLQLPQRVGAQLLHVVDHQPQPVIQRRQIRQQPLGDHPPVQVRRRRQLPDQR